MVQKNLNHFQHCSFLFTFLKPADSTTASKEEDKDTRDLLEDKDYLQSILSALPGVNPEEALHNLQQMTEAVEESKAAEEEEEGERDDGQ